MSTYKVVDADQLDTDLTSVASAIRTKGGTSADLTFPSGFVSAIEDMPSGGIEPPESPNWVRPEGCANLDALLTADTHTDVMYYTLDNYNHKFKFATCNISTTPSQSNTKHLERGHVENGVFVVDESVVFSNNQQNYIYQDFSNPWDDYPVFRVYVEDVSVFTSFAMTIGNDTVPAIEVVLKSSKSYNCGSTATKLTRRLRIDAAPTAFAGKAMLQKVTISDTSNITSCQNMFVECRHLVEGNFSEWNVSNVTRFDHMFRDCIRLKNADFSNWNNSIATEINRMFESCLSIEEITFGTNFKPKPTSLYQMFIRCLSLKKITFSQFDLSNTTTMQNMFYDCASLEEINGAQYLDTSAVTGNNYPSFIGCYSLRKLPTGFVWDLSGSTEASGIDKFNARSFTELDLSSAVHTEKITFPPAITNLQLLEKVDYHGWDTSGITGFTNSNWKSPYPYYVNLGGWDLTHLTSISNLWNYDTVIEYYPPKIAVSHSYNNMLNLDHASKLRILDVLPVTTDAVTLTLSDVKNDLTDAEIAVATQKGWTVA